MNMHAKQLHVRMSESELARARALAKSCGITLSDLIRVLLQLPSKAVTERNLITLDLHTANRMYREMRHWGYQRNQAVHALNRIAYYLERNSLGLQDVRESLSDANSRLQRIERQIEPLEETLGELAAGRIAYL